MNLRELFQDKKPFLDVVMMMTMFVGINSMYAQSVSGTISGHNYVDLGLPSGVLWATCNVGAYAPQQYGSYFAWGETRSKSFYSQANSVTHDKSLQSIESTQYDAAAINWHASWRLPTLQDANELVQRCTWIWTSIAGTNGYKVIGPNGKWIFLPAAGYTYEGNFNAIGNCGFYWTSAPNTYNLSAAYSLGFTYYQGIHEVKDAGRSAGRSVRPVISSQNDSKNNEVLMIISAKEAAIFNNETNNIQDVQGTDFRIFLSRIKSTGELTLSGQYTSTTGKTKTLFSFKVISDFEKIDASLYRIQGYHDDYNSNGWHYDALLLDDSILLDHKTGVITYHEDDGSKYCVAFNGGKIVMDKRNK